MSLKARTHLADMLWANRNSWSISMADSSGLRILNIFNRGSQLTIIEPVVDIADSMVESAESTANFTANPVKIGLWVRAFRDKVNTHKGLRSTQATERSPEKALFQFNNMVS